MTITSSLSRMPAQAGNGVTTAFPYTFKILDEDDILVVLKESDGTETEQIKTTHYTVSGVGDLGGGSVNFVTAPPTGVEVHLVLDPAFTQLVDYQADEYESAFDRATLQNKRVKDIADRSIRVSEASGVAGADLNLVPAANSVIGWDENSQIESKVLADLGEITSVTSPLALNGNVLSLNATIPQNKTDATLAPTIYNDSSQGYTFLSRWGGPALDDVYVCIDATVGAAVWQLTTGELAGLDTVDTAHIDDGVVIADKLGIDVAKILQFQHMYDGTDYTRTSSTYGNMGTPLIITPKSTTSTLLVLFTARLNVIESGTSDDLGFIVVPHFYRGSDQTFYAVGTQMYQQATNLDGGSSHAFSAGNSSLVKLNNIDDNKYNGNWYVILKGAELYSGTGTIYSQQAIALEVEL